MMFPDIVLHRDEDAVLSFLNRNRDNELPSNLFRPVDFVAWSTDSSLEMWPWRVIAALLTRRDYINAVEASPQARSTLARRTASFHVQQQRTPYTTQLAVLGMWNDLIVTRGWYTELAMHEFFNLARYAWSRTRPLLTDIIREAKETQAKYDYLNNLAAVVRVARYERNTVNGDEDFDDGKATALLDLLDAALVALQGKGFT
jgi:hypothetical protein